jgi:DNA-binding SARP family transcriptional activator/tetratricopeptide (TPR) repeat protein
VSRARQAIVPGGRGTIVQVKILGQVEILGTSGASLALGSPKQRTVLALLLLRAGELVSVDDLVDELWADQPPRSAVANVRTYVANLRRVMADGGVDGASLQSRGPAYRLDVRPGEFDLRVMRGHVERGRLAWAEDAPQRALEELARAHSLWYGQPLQDVPLGPALAAHRVALAEEYAVLTEDYARTLLALDRPAPALPVLRTHVWRYPLREQGWALLMTALRDVGDTAGALTAFTEARGTLVEQLGIEPGAELRRLHGALLADAPDPADTEPSQEGSPIRAAPRRTGSVPSVPAQLPADVRGFAGRAEQLARLDALLDEEPGAVVISALAGTAGVGKTALAVHWAHRVRDRFPDGQLYLNLRGFDPSGTVVSPAEALRRFLDALDVPSHRIPTDLEALSAHYRTVLAGKRMLVVLDNARDVDQVRPLLPGTPTALVVVTSRNRLAGLVATEGAQPVPVDLLSAAEAREVLRRRLGVTRVTTEAEATDDLVSLCAGLPLALAIVAANAATRPHVPLAALADQLRSGQDRLRMLTTGDAVSTDLRAVLSTSYSALDDDAALLFQLLGLHPGPDVSVPAAASLAGMTVDRAGELLHRLADAHLVVEHVPGRFTFHDLLREYAHSLALSRQTSQTRSEAVHRLLDHYLHTACRATSLMHSSRDPIAVPAPQPGTRPERPADEAGAMAWFTSERRTLLAALDHAAGAGFDRHTWQLAWSVADFLDRTGCWQNAKAAHRAGLDAAVRLGDRAAQGFSHRILTLAYMRSGELDLARAHIADALDRYREVGDPVGQAHTHLTALWLEATPEGSLDRARQALDLYTEAGHRKGQADALNAIGWFQAQLGDTEQALVQCERAVALLRELNDPDGEAAALDSLGYAQHVAGQFAAATKSYRDAVALNRRLGNRYDEACIYARLGDTHHEVGDIAAAREAYREALVILRDLDHPDALGIGHKLDALECRPASTPGG